jgi:uncharacterized protein
VLPLLIVCSLFALAGWWWLLHGTPQGLGGRAPAGTWHVGDAIFCGIIASFFILGIFSATDEKQALTPEVIHGSLAFYGMIVLLVAGMAFRRGQTPQQAFGLVPAQPLRVLAIGVACIVMVYPILDLVGLAMSALGHPPTNDDELVAYFRNKLSGADLAMAAVMAVVVAPLTEELLFRGYLYGVVKKYAGRVSAMLTVALLFAAVHHSLAGLPVLLLLAVALTLAYELSGSLWAPIVMHVLFNSATLCIILWFPEWIH